MNVSYRDICGEGNDGEMIFRPHLAQYCHHGGNCLYSTRHSHYTLQCLSPGASCGVSYCRTCPTRTPRASAWAPGCREPRSGQNNPPVAAPVPTLVSGTKWCNACYLAGPGLPLHLVLHGELERLSPAPGDKVSAEYCAGLPVVPELALELG